MNPYIHAQITNMVAIAKTFNESCKMANTTDNRTANKADQKTLKKIDTATQKFISELTAIKSRE